jgi:hypothetical protein
MAQQTPAQAASSSLLGERLDALLLEQVQRLIQAPVAEERTAPLGGSKSARQRGRDAPQAGARAMASPGG